MAEVSLLRSAYRKVKNHLPMSLRFFLQRLHARVYYEKTRAENIMVVKSFYEMNQIDLEGKIVFDIGANIGALTEAFYLLKASSVIAVEPNPKLCSDMKKRFAKKSKICVVGKGVAEKEGQMEMSISVMGQASTFSNKFREYIEQEGDAYPEKCLVPMTTLDKLIEEYGKPHYCKIDVEGYELNVVRGLTQKIPLISFEYHKKFIADARSVIDYLESLGKCEYACEISNSETLSKFTENKQEIIELIENSEVGGGNIFVRYK